MRQRSGSKRKQAQQRSPLSASGRQPQPATPMLPSADSAQEACEPAADARVALDAAAIGLAHAISGDGSPGWQQQPAACVRAPGGLPDAAGSCSSQDSDEEMVDAQDFDVVTPSPASAPAHVQHAAEQQTQHGAVCAASRDHPAASALHADQQGVLAPGARPPAAAAPEDAKPGCAAPAATGTDAAANVIVLSSSSDDEDGLPVGLTHGTRKLEADGQDRGDGSGGGTPGSQAADPVTQSHQRVAGLAQASEPLAALPAAMPATQPQAGSPVRPHVQGHTPPMVPSAPQDPHARGWTHSLASKAAAAQPDALRAPPAAQRPAQPQAQGGHVAAEV